MNPTKYTITILLIFALITGAILMTLMEITTIIIPEKTILQPILFILLVILTGCIITLI